MICRPVPEVESVKLDNSLFGKAIYFFYLQNNEIQTKNIKVIN